jgi:hypothetical protein
MQRTVRIELARTKEYPEGSASHGYEFRVPATADGHIDAVAWRANRKLWTVRRFWKGEEDQHGRLIHTRHGTWAFSYAPGEDDDTPFFHLEGHLLKLGEYVSIREHEGETLPFRVVAID